MRVGITLPISGGPRRPSTYAELRELAVAAETSQLDSVWAAHAAG